jgi:putative membrane protein
MLLSSGVSVDNFATVVVVAVVLGVVNTFIRPILLIVTLPINFLTLGLFTLVINAFMVLLADYFVTGFSVESFTWALLFSLVLSIISSVLYKLTK